MAVASVNIAGSDRKVTRAPSVRAKPLQALANATNSPLLLVESVSVKQDATA